MIKSSNLEQIQSYWLITDINDIEQCYFDVSDTRQKKEHIYSIDRLGNSRTQEITQMIYNDFLLVI